MNGFDLKDAVGLLQRYYAHDLTKMDPEAWSVLADAARPTRTTYPGIADALMRIASANDEDKLDFEYEFNRLFVGPDRPSAPPYETVYVAKEDTLMRDTTLELRDAYLKSGLQVDMKNIEPDDHLAFELAYVSHLLEGSEQGDLSSFCADHISQWVGPHLDAVRTATRNEVCLGFADLLDNVADLLDFPRETTTTEGEEEE